MIGRVQMKKLNLLSCVFLPLFFILFACSSGQSEKSESKADSNHSVAFDQAVQSEEEVFITEDANGSVEKSVDENTSDLAGNNRMVIYNANIEIEVKDFDIAQEMITNLVNNYNGYLVDSSIYTDHQEQMNGNIVARIPQEKFQQFLSEVESIGSKVRGKNVSGQDVTDQYVDLEARLKSKRAVEKRLLQFIEDAENTKDLLAISKDLAIIQEEIERLLGQIKYLENQSSLSTVTIQLYENKIIIPDIEKEDLNTFEKTKKQFMDSINFLLALISSLFVFVVGNSPVLVIILAFIITLFIVIKKRTKKGVDEDNT